MTRQDILDRFAEYKASPPRQGGAFDAFVEDMKERQYGGDALVQAWSFFEEGYEAGHNDGYAQGHEHGHAEGYSAGWIDG